MFGNKELYEKWQRLYQIAKDNMRTTKHRNGVLIEVSAQHPLIDGCLPNDEFEKRLRAAMQLFNEEIFVGKAASIYVPGSRHTHNGVDDKISLSSAGKNFLMANGVPESCIFGDEMNEKFKGESGVYNSTDECYVACKIYEELQFGEMHCVCSSGQLLRKALSYIRFGYIPYMHAVSCDSMFHDYVDEVFKYIPILLTDETGLQGKSEEAERLRELRKPK